MPTSSTAKSLQPGAEGGRGEDRIRKGQGRKSRIQGEGWLI